MPRSDDTELLRLPCGGLKATASAAPSTALSFTTLTRQLIAAHKSHPLTAKCDLLRHRIARAINVVAPEDRQAGRISHP
jgi:hypothetical protein